MFTRLSLLFFLICSTAYADNPPETIYDEGTRQGVAYRLNCVGAGIACTQSGITGTITVNGGGSGSVGIGTANTITYWDTTSSIGSLNTATYPSLTELSYGKGVTSAIQTQIDGKQATGSYLTAVTSDSPLSGSGTSGSHLVLSTAGTWAGTAANVTTNANLTGDVTSVGNATTIATVNKPWQDGGTNIYETTTTDTVGIGTTTPNALTSLEIVKQSSSAPLMISSAPTGGGNYLIINSAGNFGIGTRGPTSLLQVGGTANATTLQQGGVGVVTTARALTIAGTTNQITSSAGSQDLSSDRTWTLSLPSQATPWIDGGTNIYQSLTTDTVGIGTTGATGSFEIVKQGSTIPLMVSSVATGDGDYLIVTSAGNVGIGTPIAGSKLTVNGPMQSLSTGDSYITGGNVGIGTTTPSTTLEIVKQSTQAPLMLSSVATGDGDLFIVTSTGNVGIGTLAPQRLLFINGSSPEGRFIDTDPTGYASFRFFNGSTSMVKFESAGPSSADLGLFTVANIGNFPMSFDTNNTPRLRIAADGNVGIGTATAWPSKFEVRNTTNNIWSIQAAANQACNTTCTAACVFGFDTALGGTDLVACTDATADRCLCAGSN